MSNKKKKETMEFQKEYEKIMKGVTPYYLQQSQWTTPGDIFEAFSLLKKSPTTTSSNTVAIEAQKNQNA